MTKREGREMRMIAPRDPTVFRRLLSDVRFAPLWLALRLVIGWVWIDVGWRSLQGSNGQATAGSGDLLAAGMTLTGIALVLGLLTGPAAFFGGCLSAGFWPGGDPILAALQFAAVIGLVVTWKTAGWIGLDRWLLPLLGMPWRGGALLGGEERQ